MAYSAHLSTRFCRQDWTAALVETREYSAWMIDPRLAGQHDAAPDQLLDIIRCIHQPPNRAASALVPRFDTPDEDFNARDCNWRD